MSVIRILLRSSRATTVLAVTAGLAGGAGSVGLLALIQDSLNREEAPTAALAWGFAGLCGMVLCARVASQALLIRLGQNAVFRLYTHLSRQILATPLRQLETIGTPRLLAALTEDVPAIAAALPGVPLLSVNLAILLCCLAYLAWLSPTLFLGVLGFLAFGVLTYELPVWRSLSHLRGARQEHDTLMNHFRGLTDGVKELQVHRGRRQAFLEQLLEATAGRLRERNVAGLTLYAAAGSWGQVLFVVGIGLLLFGAPARQVATREVVSGYALTILYAVSPLEAITTWLPVFGRARIAVGAVEALGLAFETEGDAEVGRQTAPAHCESLELAGIMHEYGEGSEDGFRLGPVDFSVRPGELVFLAGGNGSGKTTLAKLLVGLYSPGAGEIRLNGQLVRGTDREQYRQLFSVVFADAHLFDRLLGIGRASLEADLRHYLSRFELGHKVRVEEDRFSTTDLSHGQRKRLALLTAYLEDRPVYVFDEWAADQDPRFREIFYTTLLPELKSRGKAVIAISHDERYFGVADRIVRLDFGKIQPAEAGA